MKLFIIILLSSSAAVAQSICLEKENFFKSVVNELTYVSCMLKREPTAINKKMCKTFSDNLELQFRRQAK